MLSLKRAAFGLFLLLVPLLVHTEAHAQSGMLIVLPNGCGTAAYRAGALTYGTQTTTGLACTNTAGGTSTVVGNQSNAVPINNSSTNIGSNSYNFGQNAAGTGWDPIEAIAEGGGLYALSFDVLAGSELGTLINSPDLGAVTTAAPTYTTATNGQLSLTTNGGLRVNLADSTAPSPQAVTPAAGTAHVIVTGGTAVTVVTGPVKGCYIQNPYTATDEGIATAETAYVNSVTTATTSALNGTSTPLPPGAPFYCPAGMTGNVSANAPTSSHSLVVVVW
jgi:hypothetical protein